MGWASEDNRAEWAIDVGAAAIFAAAVGFALWAAAFDGSSTSLALVASAFLLAFAGLRNIPADQPGYALPAFAAAPIEPTPQTGDDAAGELILQDMLATVSPDARVVRLFGPGQSNHSSNPPANAPDASQELNDALAELRRSLR
ncbi:MAG: hypothetical protein ABI422_01525 [Sphingomicrobium sp.]